MKGFLEALLTSFLVDADAHTADRGDLRRTGWPVLRQTAVLVPGPDGVPVLELLSEAEVASR